MNTQFNRKSISNGISTFTTSMAMTVGCMFGAVSIEASALPVTQPQAVQTRRALAPLYLEVQRAATDEFLSTTRGLISSLDETIALVEGLEGASERHESHSFEAHADTLRELERRFDQTLTEARMKGFLVSDEVKQCRKMLAHARFKLAHIGAYLRHLEGGVSSFDSNMDMEALRSVAATRTDVLSQRIH